MKLILLAQVWATLFMVGLIWFVQVVHYPLFAHVGRTQFPEYERLHNQFTTWIVGPVMLLELTTAMAFLKDTAKGTQLIGHCVFASGLSAACFHKLDSDSGMDSARLHCHRSRVPQSLRQGSLNGVFGAVHGLIGVRFTFIQVQFRS